MKRAWLHKIERIVDKLIVPALLLLIVIIVLELGFHDFVEHHHLQHWIHYADYLVIAVFIVDLIFKYLRSKTLPEFFRSSWIDIMAVFPFFILFRFVGAVAGLFSVVVLEGGQMVQSILHSGIEMEKTAVRVATQAEKIAKFGRSARFIRFLRPILRAPRLVKAAGMFYAEPHGKHWNSGESHLPEYTLKKEKSKKAAKSSKGSKKTASSRKSTSRASKRK